MSHDWLRDQGRRLAALALPNGGAAIPEDLRTRLVEFCEALRAHIDIEEDMLKPTLRHIDAWGQVRVERMEEDHRGQRIRIEQLRAEAADARVPIQQIAAAARSFVSDLLVDMDREEAELINPDLLRDDVLVIGQADG